MSFSIDNKEKIELRNRINDTIDTIKYKRNIKKRIFFLSLSAAAIVVALLTSANFIDNDVDSLKNQMVNTNLDLSEGGDVKLYVDNDSFVNLKEKTPELIYSSTGSELQVKDTIIKQPKLNSEKPNINVLTVPYGKSTSITLSDKTKVWLNSGSKLSYPNFFEGDSRQVFLEGEAIFEVAHNEDKPFYVHTENSKVKVLGTVFNVSSYSDEQSTQVALKSGSVEVSYKLEGLLKRDLVKRLSPGMTATFNKKQEEVIVKNDDIDDIMSWRDGVFIFENQPLDKILKRIARYYNVFIKVDESTNLSKTFSGSLHVEKSVEQVMSLLSESINVKYVIKKNN